MKDGKLTRASLKDGRLTRVSLKDGGQTSSLKDGRQTRASLKDGRLMIKYLQSTFGEYHACTNMCSSPTLPDILFRMFQGETGYFLGKTLCFQDVSLGTNRKIPG